jgi:fluoride exporter
MTALLVVLGAMVGAPARYLTDRYVQARHDTVFPWGTFAVNVVGSFLLGLLAAAASRHGLPKAVVAFGGTGFCGALTTYSTFSYDTVRLMEDRSHLHALANIVASIIAGLGAVVCGAAFAMAL